MHDNAVRKEVGVSDSEPQSYMREKIQLTIFQVDSIECPLRAVFRIQEDKLMESLKTRKYKYGVLLMPVTSPASRKLSSASVDSMLKKRGKDRFFKNESLFAIVDCRHRSSCTRKLATSGQPSVEWASRPVSMTLMTASGSKLLRN